MRLLFDGCPPEIMAHRYLADVPGFMIGTVVEEQGIIRAGAKMIAAVRPTCSRREEARVATLD
jgi:hypothetical protein